MIARMLDSPLRRGTSVLAFLDGLVRRTVWTVIFASISFVVVADLVTVSEAEVGAIYLFPIFLATWRLGRREGLLVAIICAALWLGIDMQERAYASRVHEIWNAVLQFATFLAFSSVVFALRTALDHERQLAHTDPLTGAASQRAFEAAPRSRSRVAHGRSPRSR